MTSRVLSLWLPDLAIDRIRRDRPSSVRIDGPMATFVQQKGKLELVSLCPLARQARLAPRMALADARAILPRLAVYPADVKADARLLEKAVLWCERYTPWVAIDRSHDEDKGGALWLDITGCAHLFGGEAALRQDLLAFFKRQGLNAKAAIADHPGAAWALARYGDETAAILPPQNTRIALAPLPVSALRIKEEQAALLARLGLDRIERLFSLPRQSLTARFGELLVKRLDQALGLVDEPISPHAPLPAHRAQMIFADPLTNCESLPLLTEQLLRQLCVSLEAAGLGARRLVLALYRVDNSTASISIGTSRPCRQVKLLARLFREHYQKIDLGFGIERAILEAIEIEPLLPEKIIWRGLGTDDDEPLRDLAPLVDRLCNRLGEESVTRLVPRASHLPERAQQSMTAFSHGAVALDLAPETMTLPCHDAPPRPLRLFRKPEPIEAIAPLPDEPPILFRWRRGVHKIVRAQGPERIAPEWWRVPDPDTLATREGQDRHTRDYFAVEDSEGGRFWLFREGLYATSPAKLPRWYLHGLFA